MTPTEILARLDARPLGKLEREAAKLIRELMGWQESLGPEFTAAIFSNIEALYDPETTP